MRHYRIAIIFILLAIVGHPTLLADDHTRHVNLFIGTGAHGHTHPAAVVPHGMVQPGPDTRWSGWDACSGYHYEDSTINGFAYTRLSGTGCADFGDFLLMPFTGNLQTKEVSTTSQAGQERPWASTFSHAEETAEPGYYAVTLQRYGIRAEMTATERAAIHRFTFPNDATTAGLLLDLSYAIQDQITLDADVEVIDSVTIRAHRRSYWWAYNQELFYYAKFSVPFSCIVHRDTIVTDDTPQPRCLLEMHFKGLDKRQLMVRAAISAVDYDGAERNLQAEIPAFRFDDVRAAAHDKWEAELGKIDVLPPATITQDEAQQMQTIFYTALYHAALSPSLFSDTDGRYRGMDLRIHAGNAASPNYTVFSLWDTFRALHPLVSLLAPEQNEAYIRCLLRKGEEGGCVPKWDCASNYTACMPGYHFASLVADAYAKGCRDFDAQAALCACLKLATGDTTYLSPVIPKYKVRDLLPEARRLNTTLGYIPCDRTNESVAKGLEYAYDDWCIATLAEAIGDKATATAYQKRAQAYRNYFDKSVRFMRGKDSQQQWRSPFDPRRSEHRTDDYCEGNAWQWTWFVPHDVAGLIQLMGGKRPFVAKLDSLFQAPSELTGNLVSADISGLIGQYAHGNEPGHHIPYLYNYADRPDRTQEVCDSILHTLYATSPDGLAGNEDCGQMSAWYLLSAMGIYQVCPGRTEWTIGRPLFERVVLHLPNDKQLTIQTTGNSRQAKYIKAATLNGRRLKRPFLTHAEIMAGGTLQLEMSTTPRRSF